MLEKLKQMLSSPPGILPVLTWWELVDAVDALGALSIFTPEAEKLLSELLEYDGMWPRPPMPTHAMPPEELVKQRALLILQKQWEELSPSDQEQLDPQLRSSCVEGLRKVEEEAVSPQLKELARRLARLIERQGA